MSQDQSLTDFKTVGQPTAIDELEADTPADIVEAFHELESWAHRVTVNQNSPQLLVGDRANHAGANTEYYLYYLPDDPNHHGVAGVLGLERRFDGPTTVGFLPAAQPPIDEMDGSEAVFEDAIATPVTALDVQTAHRTATLDAILDHIRTELTGVDWSSGRPEPSDEQGRYGYGEWMDAMNALWEFLDEHEMPYYVPNGYLDGTTMHGIARYPGDTAKLLSQAALRLDRSDTDPFDASETPSGDIAQKFKRGRVPLNRATTSPFMIRRLLLDYAAVNADLSEFDVSVTRTTPIRGDD